MHMTWENLDDVGYGPHVGMQLLCMLSLHVWPMVADKNYLQVSMLVLNTLNISC